MDNQVRDELVLEAASKIHEAWCEGEMRAFYKRFYEVYKTGSTIGDALRQACFKNGIKRNAAKLVDFDYVLGHTVMIDEAFRSYEGFKRMLELEYYELKRFVPELPAGVVYLLVGASAFGGAILLYEVIIRIPVVRWCVLGLGKERKHV